MATEEKAEVPVEYGDGQDYVIVRPAQAYSQIWNKSIPLSSIHQEITLDQNVVAPVNAGDKLGTLELSYGGETLATIDLIATQSLARSERSSMVTVAKSFIGSDDFYTALKITVGFFLAYTVLIIVLKIVVHNQNKKRSRLYGTPKKRK